MTCNDGEGVQRSRPFIRISKFPTRSHALLTSAFLLAIEARKHNGRLGLRHLGSAARSFSSAVFRCGGSISCESFSCEQSLSLFISTHWVVGTDGNIDLSNDAPASTALENSPGHSCLSRGAFRRVFFGVLLQKFESKAMATHSQEFMSIGIKIGSALPTSSILGVLSCVVATVRNEARKSCWLEELDLPKN
jgi:hypothetical protein